MRQLLCVLLVTLSACGDGDDGPNQDAASNDDGGADQTPPGAVTALTAVASETGPPQVTLSWTKPSDADVASVVVLRGDSPIEVAPGNGTDLEPGQTVDGATVAYVGTGDGHVDTDIFGGRMLHYAVVAVDSSGNYGQGAMASARPGMYVRATVTVPVDDGPVTVTHMEHSGNVTIAGTVGPGDGTDQVTVSFTNLNDRILFNPKMVVTNLPQDVTVDAGDTYAGEPFYYYGPEGIAPDAVTREVAWDVIGATRPYSFDIELVTHPMVYASHQDTDEGGAGALSFVDTGRHAEVGVTDAVSITTGVWFSVLSPDMRTLYLSEYGGPTVWALDTTTLTAASVAIAPEPDGNPTGVFVSDLVVSPDGNTLFVAASSTLVDETMQLMLVKLDVSGTPAETGRVLLGAPAADSASNGIARGLAVDWAAGRAYVAQYESANLHVVDTAALSAVDVDGDGENGITPVVFGSVGVTSVCLHPDGSRMYVGFGRQMSNAIAELDRADLGTITLLPVTSPAESTAPNMKIAPSGHLVVPRNQYPQETGDPDSYGISVLDIDSPSVVETFVNVVTSEVEGNNDLWDVVFLAGGKAYGAMADAGKLFLFDTTTWMGIDIDGDAENGHTTVSTSDDLYGGSLAVTY